MMRVRAQAQIEEILGDYNRWLCSEHFKREVTDARTLCRYFCDQGGAADFARRWDEAMGATNRYYCGRHFGHPVEDEQSLWEYYMANRDPGDVRQAIAELSVA